MTPEQKKKYLESGGMRCPYCESEAVGGEEVVVDVGSCFQNMFCGDCKESWGAVYHLVSAEPLDAEALAEYGFYAPHSGTGG